MKKLINYIPVILGVIFVSGAILMTGGFSVNNQYTLAEDTKPVETTAPDPQEVLADKDAVSPTWDYFHIFRLQEQKQNRRPAITGPSQESVALSSTSPTSTSSTSSTSTGSTATTTTTTARYSLGGRFSSIRVFLDLQRIIFYKVDPATGQEFEAYAIRCSTGTARYPTPAPGPSRPYYLGGRKSALTIFRSSKSTIDCWVRYATHLSGSIWFHSVPYDLLKDSQGRARFDPTRCYMYNGYDVLGRRTSSHGCIRMALRDAQFLYNNSYRGMPCYVISSYSSAFPGRSPLGPAPLPAALSGSRNWDPTDPNYPGYQAPAPFPTEPETTVPEPTEPTEPTPAPTTTPKPTTVTKPTTTAAATTTTAAAPTTTAAAPTTEPETTEPMESTTAGSSSSGD